MNNQFERNNRNPCLHIGFHEAGHYVVAKALGFKTNGIVIKNINDLSICLNTHVETESASIYQDIRTNDDICAYLEKRIQVLFAGVLAEPLFERMNPEKSSEYLNRCIADNLKVIEIINILVNINCYDASSVEILSHIDSISSKSWKKTIEIVDAKKDMIWMVGLKLADNIQAGKDYFTEDDYSFLCQKN